MKIGLCWLFKSKGPSPFLKKYLHMTNINAACCVIKCIRISHWRKMFFHLWLLLYMTPIAVAKCANNYYYDGLIEDCQPCSIRCKSPPSICVTYCKSPACKYGINQYFCKHMMMMCQSSRWIYDSCENRQRIFCL